jgi:hypothetical protein
MSQTPARSRAATALLAALLVTMAACSGGGGGKAKAPTTTTTKVINTSVALRVTGATVSSAGPNVAFPADLRDQLSQAVNQYVESAVVSPLRSGAVAPNLGSIFTADAGAKLNGPDRPTLTEEGVPKVTGDITPTTADCALTALADTGSQIVLVSAALNLDLQAQVPGGALHLIRKGDLLFANVGGAWRVAGFDMSVLRGGPGVQTAAGHVRAVPSA